jgi:hypothetical protein
VSRVVVPAEAVDEVSLVSRPAEGEAAGVGVEYAESPEPSDVLGSSEPVAAFTVRKLSSAFAGRRLAQAARTGRAGAEEVTVE